MTNDQVDWNVLAANVQANFAATGQWFASSGMAPTMPPAGPVDWNALAAQVQANFAATGQWYLQGSAGPAPTPPPPPTSALPTIFLNDVARGNGGYVIVGAGDSLAPVADLTGDGRPDLVVGEVGIAAYVVEGRGAGRPQRVDQVGGLQPGYAILPERDNALAWDVSSTGDMNGDGLPEVVVSAHSDVTNGVRAGGAYVVFGKTGGAPVQLADIAAGRGGFKITGEAEPDLAGFSLAGLGDVNGDSRPDLLLGAWQAGVNGRFSGAAYVVFGKADGAPVSLLDVAQGQGGFRLDGVTLGSFSGREVAAARDMNGDGLAEMLVGAPSDLVGTIGLGQVFVVFGKTDTANVSLETLMKQPSGGFVIETEQFFDGTGQAMAEVGDVNGDGIPDILVGSSGNGANATGAAYLVWGQAEAGNVKLASVAQGIGGFKIIGAQENSRAGAAVSGAGDLNGDGLPDLLVGAINQGSGNLPDDSSVYVVWGKRDGDPVDLDDVARGDGGFRIALQGRVDGSFFRISGSGDLNGDGVGEILIGSGQGNISVVLSQAGWLGAS